MPHELISGPGVRRRAAVAVVVTAVAGLLALTPGPARADVGPVSAVPAVGGVLDTAPQQVTVEFAGRVDEVESHVAVLDADSRRVDEGGEPTRSGAGRLQLPVRIETPGDYTVAYHVIFTDGTSATGAYRFSVGTGVPPAALDDEARRVSTALVAEHAHQVDGFSAFLLVVDGAVLAVVLALLWLRPRGRRQAMSLRADPRF